MKSLCFCGLLGASQASAGPCSPAQLPPLDTPPACTSRDPNDSRLQIGLSRSTLQNICIYIHTYFYVYIHIGTIYLQIYINMYIYTYTLGPEVDENCIAGVRWG